MTLKEVGYIIGKSLTIENLGNYNWHVKFKGVEVKDGVLISASGIGPTSIRAKDDYAKQLSYQTIVLDAYSSDRKEFNLPKVTA